MKKLLFKIISFFKPKPKSNWKTICSVGGDDSWPDPLEDPMSREAIETCFKTGKMVVGNRDKNGEIKIKIIDKKND